MTIQQSEDIIGYLAALPATYESLRTALASVLALVKTTPYGNLSYDEALQLAKLAQALVEATENHLLTPKLSTCEHLERRGNQ